MPSQDQARTPNAPHCLQCHSPCHAVGYYRKSQTTCPHILKVLTRYLTPLGTHPRCCPHMPPQATPLAIGYVPHHCCRYHPQTPKPIRTPRQKTQSQKLPTPHKTPEIHRPPPKKKSPLQKTKETTQTCLKLAIQYPQFARLHDRKNYARFFDKVARHFRFNNYAL